MNKPAIPSRLPGLSPEQRQSTWRQLPANLATLENNYNQFPANQGVVREGPTLLQGLVWCKLCGRKMRVCYNSGQPYYTYDGEHRKVGTAICRRVYIQPGVIRQGEWRVLIRLTQTIHQVGS